MTREEVEALRCFDHYCTCGGFAHTMNGRPAHDPHMVWCPQRPQWLDWYQALHSSKEAAT
jgi:hypothetical protein